MKKTITLNEEQLRGFLKQCVKNTISQLNEGKQPKKVDNRIRSIVRECVNEGLAEAGKFGMYPQEKEFRTMQDKLDQTNPQSLDYEQLSDRVAKLEDMLRKIIAMQKKVDPASVNVDQEIPDASFYGGVAECGGRK